MWADSGPAPSSAHTSARLRWGNARLSIALVSMAAVLPALSAMARVYATRSAFDPAQWGEYPSVVAIDLDSTYLREITDGARQRGRSWERPGRVSFYRNGEQQFESPVGIRIHGGTSRYSLTNQPSFRIYFRPRIGRANAPGAAIGLARASAHRVVILHGDERNEKGAPEWHYASPVAYAIAERLRVPAPSVTPATLIVNGAPGRPYVLTEYVDMDFLERRFGHRDFELYAYRSSEGMPRRGSGPIAELRRRFGEPTQWTAAQIGEVVDLENLTSWFLTVVLCGSHDFAQGRLVRDRTQPDAKWFWVAWDFDASFGRVDPVDDPWHFDHFNEIFTATNDDARYIILRQLLRNSDEYKHYFAERFADARDHALTPAFVDQLLSRYEHAARLNHIADTTYQVRTREFFAKRPAIVQEQIVRHLHVNVP